MFSYFKYFFSLETSPSIFLGVCTLLAILTANSSFSDFYISALEANFIGLSLHHWINDGLMAIFFFSVAMEIKREFIAGELSNLKKASLPIFAALGGMIVPALIYITLNPDGASQKGWAIPTATDIAFALAVLTFLGKRVPIALRVFLLTLAIVDDLGAILIIALFYAKELQPIGLFIALIVTTIMFFLFRRKNSHSSFIFFLIPLSIALWLAVLFSGIHATIAGVVLGFLIPFARLDYFIQKLHNWIHFLIMPSFAFANAGILLEGIQPSLLFTNSISLGIFLGLVLGKPIGIISFSFIAVQLKLATLSGQFSWKHLIGVACLGGIGFTMSIFISSLSLSPDEINLAKGSVLLASFCAAILGYTLIMLNVKAKRISK